MSNIRQYIIHKSIDGTYSNEGEGLTSGGTIDSNNLIIDTDNAEALLVRKDGDAGDVFKVDTITAKICYTDGTEGASKILTSDALGCASWETPAGVGEVNTASNQGAGAGVFKQKTGTDLEFNSVEGGTGITDVLATDVITFNLDNTAVTPATYGDNNSVGQFTVDQQGRITSASNVNISHDALTDFVGNEHIDHSTISLSAGTGISGTGLGDLTASRTINIADTAVTPATYGTSNDVSQITVDQQGRITSASDVAIDHDALLNFVANEHVDHSTVSLSAGTGISGTGLGDLTASRTINIADTAVTPATYGTSNDVSQITIDQQGRITSASDVAIDHDALLNFVGNEHVDHSTVSLSAGTGISATGLGDITASRTINIADTAVTPATYGDASNVSQITIDQQGRITSAVDVPIVAGATSSLTLTGDIDTVFASQNVATASGNAEALYNMDTTADDSGNGRTLVVGGGSPSFADEFQGKKNVCTYTASAFHQNDAVAIAVQSSDCTIAFWLATTNFSNGVILLYNTSTTGYTCQIDTVSGNYRVKIGNPTDFVRFTTDDVIVDANGNWDHIVLSMTSTGTTFYVNGLSVPLTFDVGNASTSTVVGSDANRFVIGSTLSNTLGGTIGSVYVLSQGVSATEALNLYQGATIGVDKTTIEDFGTKRITINDGNQATGHYLVCQDTAGLGEWKAPPAVSVPAYGAINSENNSTASALTTTNVYVEVPWETNNPENDNCTPDSSNNRIQIDVAGLYFVSFNGAYNNSPNQLEWRLHVNGSGNSNMHTGSTSFSSAGYTNISFNGFLTLAVNDLLTVRVRSNSVIPPNTSPILRDGNLSVFKIN